MTDAALPPGSSPQPYRHPTQPPHTAVPQPVPVVPSRLQVALGEFWRGQAVPLPRPALGLAGAAAVVGAGLLVGHDLGLGAAVTGALVWAAAAPALVRRRAWAAGATALLSVALVGVVAVRSAPWVLTLCLLTAAGVGAVAAVQARSAPAVWLALPSWAAGVLRALPWSVRGVRAVGGGRGAHLLALTRTVAVTAVLLVVFGLLFASADAVFASFLPTPDLADLPAQVVVAVLLLVAALTLAHLASAPPSWSRVSLPAARAARRWEWLAPVLALDLLVLSFVVVQVVALVGGEDYVRRTAGLTYAEYARQGFGQLVAATALTLVVVAVSARRAPRAASADRALSRAALGLLCVLALGVVVSALGRMDLYVDAYGLTRLRLVVVVAEVAMAAVLLLVLLAGIRWRATWLPLAVVHVVGLSVLGLAGADPDGLIVRVNASADLEAPLDLEYLRGLSLDAVPAMDALDEPLRSCLLADQYPTQDAGAPGWNLARHRAVLLDDVTERPGCAPADLGG